MMCRLAASHDVQTGSFTAASHCYPNLGAASLLSLIRSFKWLRLEALVSLPSDMHANFYNIQVAAFGYAFNVMGR